MFIADCLKVVIGWLKLIVTLFSALFASLLSWFVQNYEIELLELIGLGVFFSGVFFLIIVHSALRIHRCIRQLGEL
jgi:hypothetical protein